MDVKKECKIKCSRCSHWQDFLPLTINLCETWELYCESCNGVIFEVSFFFDGTRHVIGESWNIFEGNPRDMITWSFWKKKP
jgi:hypothetical protein